jgi:multidrug efflux pump subunit AcrB
MGLAFNSSIIVLAGIRANPRARGGDCEAIVDVVLESARHLVSTTLTTMGSFLPLLLLIGGEFWPPLAIVLAGGVGGSTLLAVLFAPAAYRLLVKRGSLQWSRVEKVTGVHTQVTSLMPPPTHSQRPL